MTSIQPLSLGISHAGDVGIGSVCIYPSGDGFQQGFTDSLSLMMGMNGYIDKLDEEMFVPD